jgi:hypothetical protein
MIVVTWSTIYDVNTQKIETGERNKLLLSFSMYTNGKRLLSLEQSRSTDTINCLNGIRAFSILSIIFLHSFFFRTFTPFRDDSVFNEWIKTKLASSVSAINIFVDSFFVMSGLLVTKTMLKELDA